jgi:hypothetical protein
MNRIVRLTESDLTRIVRRAINEESIFNRSGSSSQSLPKCTKVMLDKAYDGGGMFNFSLKGEYSYDESAILILKNQGKEFCSIKMV